MASDVEYSPIRTDARAAVQLEAVLSDAWATLSVDHRLARTDYPTKRLQPCAQDMFYRLRQQLSLRR